MIFTKEIWWGRIDTERRKKEKKRYTPESQNLVSLQDYLRYGQPLSSGPQQKVQDLIEDLRDMHDAIDLFLRKEYNNWTEGCSRLCLEKAHLEVYILTPLTIALYDYWRNEWWRSNQVQSLPPDKHYFPLWKCSDWKSFIITNKCVIKVNCVPVETFFINFLFTPRDNDKKWWQRMMTNILQRMKMIICSYFNWYVMLNLFIVILFFVNHLNDLMLVFVLNNL